MKEKKTRKIAVTLNKGGSTKTTTAVHLAHALAKTGKANVLLIDCDAQHWEGNVAIHLGISDEICPKTLKDLVVNGDKEAICKARENLYIVRGGFALNELRREIDNRQLMNHLVLSEALGPLESIFDVIILDTPPSWDSLNLNALFYADEIIIPVCLEGIILSTLKRYLMVNLDMLQKYRPQPLKWGYALPTKFDGRISQSEALMEQLNKFFNSTIYENPQLSSKYSNTVLCSPVKINVSLSEAFGEGKTVFEYAPQSSGAKDYLEFAKTVCPEFFKQETKRKEAKNGRS